MTGYIILAAVLILIAVLLFAPSVVDISLLWNQNEKQLFIKYKLLFFKITLYPLKEKKKKRKKVKESKKKQDKKKYTLSDVKKSINKGKLAFDTAKDDLIKILLYLKDRAGIIKNLDLNVKFDTGDPMQTGILTGTINGVAYNIVALLDHHLRLEKWNIFIDPLFNNEEYFDIRFNCIINIRNVHINIILFKSVITAIKVALKLRKSVN